VQTRRHGGLRHQRRGCRRGRQGRLPHQIKERQAHKKEEIAEIEEIEEIVAQASVPASLQVWRQQ
jgi:hypothetical protein